MLTIGRREERLHKAGSDFDNLFLFRTITVVEDANKIDEINNNNITNIALGMDTSYTHIGLKRIC